jgi:hypothetical protein
LWGDRIEKKAVVQPGMALSTRIVSGQRRAFSEQFMPTPLRKKVFQLSSFWMLPTSRRMSWKLGMASRYAITASSSRRTACQLASTSPIQPNWSAANTGRSPCSAK